MIDSSPDLTKVMTILRFYLLIFDNIFCPPSRLLQQSSPTRRHSPDACNGINEPMQSERSRFATDTKKIARTEMRTTANNLTCTRQRRGHFSPIWESRAAGFIVERSDHAAKDVSPAFRLSSASPSKYGSRGMCTADALVRVNTNTGMPASSHSTHVPPWPEGSAVIREN